MLRIEHMYAAFAPAAIIKAGTATRLSYAVIISNVGLAKELKLSRLQCLDYRKAVLPFDSLVKVATAAKQKCQ